MNGRPHSTLNTTKSKRAGWEGEGIACKKLGVNEIYFGNKVKGKGKRGKEALQHNLYGGGRKGQNKTNSDINYLKFVSLKPKKNEPHSIYELKFKKRKPYQICHCTS